MPAETIYTRKVVYPGRFDLSSNQFTHFRDAMQPAPEQVGMLDRPIDCLSVVRFGLPGLDSHRNVAIMVLGDGTDRLDVFSHDMHVEIDGIRSTAGRDAMWRLFRVQGHQGVLNPRIVGEYPNDLLGVPTTLTEPFRVSRDVRETNYSLQAGAYHHLALMAAQEDQTLNVKYVRREPGQNQTVHIGECARDGDDWVMRVNTKQ